MSRPISSKPALLVSYTRFQVIAILATIIDFLILILFTEVFRLWYVASTALGAFAGATFAFVLGRNWVFASTRSKHLPQAIRYLIVAAGSIILNSTGVYILTEFVELQYLISKIIIAALVGITYNYILSRNYVFK